MENEIILLAEKLGHSLLKNKFTLALAESCTGGGIAHAVTAIEGSSKWFDRGFVTYSNQAKMEMIDVNEKTLDKYGAVSAETAMEMVEGVLKNSNASCAISITGIAGAGGGTKNKPVGTVFIGWKIKDKTSNVQHFLFDGDRTQVRQQAIAESLQGLLKII